MNREKTIQHEGGIFWNAENDCWTTAEQAATAYEAIEDLPLELPQSNAPGASLIDAEPMITGGAVYCNERGEVVATWGF